MKETIMMGKEVFQAAQAVSQLTSLALFIGRAENAMHKHGQPLLCKLQLMDQHGTVAAVSSDILMEALSARFDKLAAEVDSLGINAGDLLQELATNLEKEAAQ